MENAATVLGKWEALYYLVPPVHVGLGSSAPQGGLQGYTEPQLWTGIPQSVVPLEPG